VTDILQSSACHIAQEAILKGGVVKALLLKGFGGLLKTELQPNVRLGTEFAHRAMYWGRVNGIIHTDELPGYGIEEDDLDKLGEKLNAGDKDAFVLVADTEDGVDEALVAVSIRAKEALRGAPEETRGPNPDGTTRYMRPRPGAARMYPETDVPPTPVTPEMRDRIREKLPPMPDVIAKHLMDHYRLNSKLAQQLINSEFLALFEHVVAQTKVPATFIATVLTETIKSLERRGIPVENLSEEQVEEAIETVDSGLTAKESMEEILSWLAMNPKSSAFDAIDKKNLHMFSEGELANTIERVIAENQRLVERERENAFGKLMKIVMAEVRGRADAKAVSDLIKIALKKSRA